MQILNQKSTPASNRDIATRHETTHDDRTDRRVISIIRETSRDKREFSRARFEAARPHRYVNIEIDRVRVTADQKERRTVEQLSIDLPHLRELIADLSAMADYMESKSAGE